MSHPEIIDAKTRGSYPAQSMQLTNFDQYEHILGDNHIVDINVKKHIEDLKGALVFSIN